MDVFDYIDHVAASASEDESARSSSLVSHALSRGPAARLTEEVCHEAERNTQRPTSHDLAIYPE